MSHVAGHADGAFIGECSCGWRGNRMRWRLDARLESIAHAESANASAAQKAEADSENTEGGAQPVSNRPSTDGESDNG